MVVWGGNKQKRLGEEQFSNLRALHIFLN